MKYKTGKAQRKRSDKPKLTLADLPPFDQVQTHCSMQDAAIYIRLSMPKIYELVKNGKLESHIIGGRRFVTAASIKRVTEGKAQVPKRAPKFVALRRVGRPSKSRRAVGAAA
jgi:excisionase family DNA binding protein